MPEMQRKYRFLQSPGEDPGAALLLLQRTDRGLCRKARSPPKPPGGGKIGTSLLFIYFFNLNLPSAALFSSGPRGAVAEGCCPPGQLGRSPSRSPCFPLASRYSFLLLTNFSRAITAVPVSRLGRVSLTSAAGAKPPPRWGWPQSALAFPTAVLHRELSGVLKPSRHLCFPRESPRHRSAAPPHL